MSTTPTQAMMVHLKFGVGKQGGRDETTTEEICTAKKAKPEGIHADVRYICKEAFDPITSLKSEFVKKVKAITTPGDVPSLYLAKASAIPKILALRDQYFPALECLKNGHLLGRYAEWKALTMEQCGDAFKPERFPSEDQLKESVRWSLAVMPLQESELLRKVQGIDAAIIEDLTAQQEARNQALFARAKAEFYKRIFAPLRHMVETLTKDGKPKIFETLVSNLSDIVAAAADLNHDDDPTMAVLAAQADALLKSIDLKALKNDPIIRKETAAAAQTMLDTFGKVGGRKFATEDAA